MAQLVLDPCGDDYRTAQLAKRFPYIAGTVTVTSGGRNGYGITGSGGGWGIVPQNILAIGKQTPTQTLFMGLAVYLPASTACQVMSCNGWNATLNINTDGSVWAEWFGSPYASTPSGTFKPGWNYVEWSCGISAAGNMDSTIRINGYQRATGSVGVPYATPCLIEIGDLSNTTGDTLIIDDLYVYDATGSDHNNFASKLFGIVPKIIVSPPTSAGRVTAWTPNGSGNNWANAANIPPVESTDYNDTPTVGDADAYTCTAPTAYGVYGVQVAADMCQSDPSGTRSVALGIGNGTKETYNNPVGLTDQYSYYLSQFPLNPNTGSIWTVASFNAAQAAIQLAS